MILCILHVLGKWGWRAPWRAGRGVKEGRGEQAEARLGGLEGREWAAARLGGGSEAAARLGGRWCAPWRTGSLEGSKRRSRGTGGSAARRPRGQGEGGSAAWRAERRRQCRYGGRR